MRKITRKTVFNEAPDCIGEITSTKKNKESCMNKFILVLLVLVLITCVIGMFGCTTMNPKDDKNVEYVFENVSYESPNSSPHDNIGEAEGKFNFNKKLPIG